MNRAPFLAVAWMLSFFPGLAFAQEAAFVAPRRLAVGPVSLPVGTASDAAQAKSDVGRLKAALETRLGPALVATGRFLTAGSSADTAPDSRLDVAIESLRRGPNGLGAVVRLSVADPKAGTTLVEPAKVEARTMDPRKASPDDLAAALSAAIVRRVTEAVYPARVTGRRGKFVTVSRGEGSDISVGQQWEVYGQGEEKRDPDTGASMGRDEISLGRVRIVRVMPESAEAEVLKDAGIERGAVTRPVAPTPAR